MSEYIISDELDVLRQWMPKLTEIVRCRDCKFYSEKTYKWVNGWMRTSTTCALFDGCRVEPDGFCAWGERRERESAEVWNQWSADDVTCSEES